MKSLVESLFDSDLKKKDISYTLENTLTIIKDYFSKKFKVPVIDARAAKRSEKKEGTLIYYEDDEDMIWLVFNNAIEKHEMNNFDDIWKGVCLSICFSKPDSGEDEMYIMRVDFGWSNESKYYIEPHWWCLWDDEGYKKKSKLKDNKLTSDNIKNIFDYVCRLYNVICSKENTDILITMTRGSFNSIHGNIEKIEKELVKC